MEKGKGKEMREAMVHDRKSYACLSSPDLSVGDNMTPAVEKNVARQNSLRRKKQTSIVKHSF